MQGVHKAFIFPLSLSLSLFDLPLCFAPSQFGNSQLLVCAGLLVAALPVLEGAHVGPGLAVAVADRMADSGAGTKVTILLLFLHLLCSSCKFTSLVI